MIFLSEQFVEPFLSNVLLDVFVSNLLFLSLTDGIDYVVLKSLQVNAPINFDDFIVATSFQAWQ